MKYLKMLGLAVLAAGLLAVGGTATASATELTCGTSMCAAETTIKSESEGRVVLDAPFGNVEAELSVEGATENTGSSSETIRKRVTKVTVITIGGDSWVIIKTGLWNIHLFEPPNAKVTWSGWSFKIVHLGVECIYETNETEIGTLTGSKTTGSNATLDIKATIPRTGGSGGVFCGSSAPLTGSLKITSPTTLNVD
ncbi:MAG: hypothetical protein ACTHN7_00280 [Solirubrobacterales bacterium]